LKAFADSSALVKRYFDEEGSDMAQSLDRISASRLARVEVNAALWAKHRAGHASGPAISRMSERLALDFHGTPDTEPRFDSVALDDEILEDAAELAALHPLSAGDAIQLASALAVRAADPECRTFACFDARLRDAAAKTGFALLP
jgi:uncharacterized protein